MHSQIFYSLSEKHTHPDFRPSDSSKGVLPSILLDVLSLVVDHAAYLLRLHRQHAWGDTALLVVSLSLTQGSLEFWYSCEEVTST